MTKEQAKQVIDMMFKDKTDIPKEDVFKVIDMIDEVSDHISSLSVYYDLSRDMEGTDSLL